MMMRQDLSPRRRPLKGNPLPDDDDDDSMMMMRQDVFLCLFLSLSLSLSLFVSLSLYDLRPVLEFSSTTMYLVVRWLSFKILLRRMNDSMWIHATEMMEYPQDSGLPCSIHDHDDINHG